MTNRSLAAVIGIPVALLLIAAVFVAANPGLRTGVSMMGVSQTAVSPSFIGGDVSFMGEEMAERGMAFDKAVSAPMTGIIAPFPPEAPSGGQTAAEVDQRLVKTASLSLVVDDVAESATQAGVIASGKGGFVQDSSVSEREDGTHFGSVTVRVPVDQFESALSELKKLATLVKSETAGAQDVTEQYTDLQARLKNARAQETALLDILRRASSVEDILAVQRELSNVRYLIESLEGQIKYLANATSYSTISAYLSEEPSVKIPTKEFRPFSTAREALQALVALAQNLADALIWVAILGVGTLVPLGLVLWIVVSLAMRLVDRMKGGARKR
ncbi:hypothetical protein A2856_00580 [Candidatus Uhrbacteria bacterium RIFCSPHIGHO2_01_FULL_63_20]|uniref:DUF4349 domain-containing protein n=1 Tax=Candidatus Uhrbacteria bacterium RIFCSPHIGHO2_01_FULL_63_20 TaxID=1802385 RepID=A0A1F7TMY7_9BACT|nr:MAG: hypothetical protein A2856_00580 [Candidatus Uhrbacteria bacterium RIFCSPHIGHO2_01_FULL_63_20]